MKRNQREVVIFHKRHHIISQIRKAVAEERRIVVCTNSLEASHELANLIRTEFPEKKVLLYNSKSS